MVLIYGASGHGKVIIDIIEKEGKHKIAGLIDDNPQMQGKDFCGYPVIGGFEVLKEDVHHSYRLILAVGDNRSRKRLWEMVKPLGYGLIRAVHPSAQIGQDVFIGSGTVIMANVAINPGARIGENVIVNTGATVDHDCIIGDYAHISPGTHLAGNVRVGELTHIGIGAIVISNVKIGKGSIIGAGTVVIEDIPNDVKAVGIPAKAIKKWGEL
ncbi:MAG: acetyltransferase [Deltaproteobacteria bacterium]|nr:acetyltransferase [Deltaproteobacteria bacterium]